MSSDLPATVNRGLWSEDEHNRFLEAIQSYPHGPWRFVAEHVGTRNIRQVQTHAQKYYEKISRHLRGLRKERNLVLRAEHRIDTLPAGLHRPMITQELESRAARLGVDGDVVKIELDSGDISDSDDGGKSPNYTAAEVPSLEDSLDILLEWLEEQ